MFRREPFQGAYEFFGAVDWTSESFSTPSTGAPAPTTGPTIREPGTTTSAWREPSASTAEAPATIGVVGGTRLVDSREISNVKTLVGYLSDGTPIRVTDIGTGRTAASTATATSTGGMKTLGGPGSPAGGAAPADTSIYGKSEGGSGSTSSSSLPIVAAAGAGLLALIMLLK